MLLVYSGLYVIVGVYRFLTDRSLWFPIWTKSKRTLKLAAFLVLPYSVLAYPLTRIYVSFILARSPFTPARIHDAGYFGVSVIQYTTVSLLLGQLSWMLELALKRELTSSKSQVFAQTVASRNKPIEFWSPYVEEWLSPPIERAKRNLGKQSFFNKLSGPIVRMLVVKILLMPLAFIPFLNLIVSAGLKSLTYGRTLHAPYFKMKRMTAMEIELFLVENEYEYRLFGFVAALLERMPIVGLLFSVTNRIAAAMWSFDLEKRQHAFASGQIQRTRQYVSKTAGITTDIPGAIGAFPVTVDKDGRLLKDVEGVRKRVVPPVPTSASSA